jgi:hypothetical protein
VPLSYIAPAWLDEKVHPGERQGDGRAYIALVRGAAMQETDIPVPGQASTVSRQLWPAPLCGAALRRVIPADGPAVMF